MDQARLKRLEAAGFWVGDAADFLGMTEAERRLLDLRVAVSLAVKRRREAAGVTQAELAGLIGSGQSRVAKIESGGGKASLDLMFKALVALGGGLEDVLAVGSTEYRGPRSEPPAPGAGAAKPARRKPAGT